MRGRGGERQFHSVSGSLDALLPSEGDILIHVNYQPWKNLKESSYSQVEKTNWIVPSLRCCRKDVRALGPHKPEMPCCKERKGGFHKPIFGFCTVCRLPNQAQDPNDGVDVWDILASSALYA